MACTSCGSISTIAEIEGDSYCERCCMTTPRLRNKVKPDIQIEWFMTHCGRCYRHLPKINDGFCETCWKAMIRYDIANHPQVGW